MGADYLGSLESALKQSGKYKYILCFINSKGYSDCFGCTNIEEVYEYITNFFHFINNGNSSVEIYHNKFLVRAYFVTKESIMKEGE